MIENQMYNIKKKSKTNQFWVSKLWIFHRGLRCAENQEESLQQKISLRLNDDSTFVPRICRLSRRSLIIIRVVVSFIRSRQSDGKRSPKTRPSRLYRNGRNLSLYRSCSVVRGTPCTTDFPSFLPRSPPPPFFISPSWHWETRVAAGSNRRNDSGLRRGKKKKKNKARNRGRFEIIYSFFLFFSTPSLSFLLHDSQAWRWFCISLSLPNSFLLFLCLLFSYDDDRFRRCFLNWKHDWKTKSKRGPNVYSERTEKENFAEMKAAINRRSLLFFPPFFLFFF